MNRMLTRLVFAPALLIAMGATLLSGIGTAFAQSDTTAPVITFDRFEHTGGVVVGTTVFLNVGDTLTAFVNSDEPLAATSLVDAALFDFDGSVRPAQNLLPVVGVANQYRATYTITTADDDAGPQFNVRGVTDTADSANTAPDFRHSLGTVNIDTSASVITLEGNSPVTVAHGGTYTDAGVSGEERGDTLETTIAGPGGATAVDTNTAGDYTYTYIVTDRAGNVSNTLTRTVTVAAVEPLDGPAIQPGSFEITYSADGRFAIIAWTPLKTGTYSVKLGARTHTRATVPSELGSPVNVEFGFGSATIAGTAVLSFGGVEVARQKVGTPRPTIHLRAPDDSAFADGANRITRTGVLVVLAEGFTAGVPPTGDTWEVSTNGGADYNHTLIKLPLRRPNVRVRLTREGSYTDNQVRARQTINRVRSPFAGLDAFIYDATPPVITLTGAARIVLDVGATYTDQGATASDRLDDNVPTPTASDTVDTTTTGTYTVTYRATDHAGNIGTATREVIVQGQLAFAAEGAPVLTSNNAFNSGYAKAGDTLTLAFTTNLALASTPTVTIFVGTSGRSARVTKGAGNAYSATYTVAAAHFPDSDGVAARYNIDAMTAADDAGNTFNPPGVTSAILVDVVAPAATFPKIVGRGVVGVEQSHIITFAEAVTATMASFSDTTGATVNAVSGSGSDTLTVKYTPKAASFELSINARGITDRAGNRGPTGRQSQDGTAVEPPGISDLDGESGVSLDDAKFLYYAHALGSELDNPDVQTRVLGPLNTDAEADDLLILLTAARGSLSVDLNNDGGTTAAEVAMLYYSFALEGSLGDGDTKPGIPEIKRAILGPLAGTDDMDAIDTMLQRVYELRGQ